MLQCLPDILTINIEQSTEQQRDDGEESRKPLGVDGGVIRVIKDDAILDQVADDNATARDGCLPSQNQEPASTVAEQLANGCGCALGLATTHNVRLHSTGMSDSRRKDHNLTTHWY